MSSAKETFRGSVQTWECDEVGHQNVQFYVARADDASHALFTLLGLGQRARTASRLHLTPQNIHIRFLRELRAGDLMRCGSQVLDCRQSILESHHLLHNEGNQELSATFITRYGLSDEMGAPVAWQDAARTDIAALSGPLPDAAHPRSVDRDAAIPDITLQQTEERPDLFLPIYQGRVRPSECDVLGRLMPQGVMGRFSDGAGHLWQHVGMGRDDLFGRGRGTVVLEMGLRFLSLPVAGSELIVRSVFTELMGKTLRFRHFMFDAEQGNLLAVGEAIAIMLDLDKRKSVPFTEDEIRKLTPRIAAF